MVFSMNIRLQIASICFFIVLLADYYRFTHTNKRSARWFNITLGFTSLYLVFDIVTVYTVNYLTDQMINRVAHQIFIGSLETVIFCLFMYVETLGRNSRKYSEVATIVLSAPFMIALCFVFVGKLNYMQTDWGNYSYGPMANTVYIIAFFYVTVIFINTFRYHDTIRKKKRTALRLGLGIWVLFSVFQILYRNMLISSLAIVLELFVIYLSFENPNENYDEVTDSFNEHAFVSMTTELFTNKRCFSIINIAVIDYDTIRQNLGQRQALQLVKMITQFCNYLFGCTNYHYNENCVAIICDNVEPDKERIQRLAEQMALPFMIEHNSISAAISITVLPCPEFAEDVQDIRAMLNYTMHNVTYANKPIVYINNDLLKEKQKEEAIVALVENAIRNDGFDVYYQPIYSTDQKRFLSAEALVRLKDTKTFGFLSPEVFIPIAERNGLIMDLGRIVFEKVCSFAYSANLTALGVEYIEVNLSGIQAVDTSLPDLLHNVIQNYHLEPAFINLEITETAAVSSGAMLRANMSRLKNIGFSFSMDDFGTGYSNLSQIADTAYDLVKLDKSLIWPCFGNNKKPKALHILKNITAMLHDIGAHIVAEGVETEEMAELLIELRVNYLQGYLYSRPICEQDYLKFLKDKQAIG